MKVVMMRNMSEIPNTPDTPINPNASKQFTRYEVVVHAILEGQMSLVEQGIIGEDTAGFVVDTNITVEPGMDNVDMEIYAAMLALKQLLKMRAEHPNPNYSISLE